MCPLILLFPSNVLFLLIPMNMAVWISKLCLLSHLQGKLKMASEIQSFSSLNLEYVSDFKNNYIAV